MGVMITGQPFGALYIGVNVFLNSNHCSTVCLISTIVSDCENDHPVANIGGIEGNLVCS